MMTEYSQTPDWGWFGFQTFDELCCHGHFPEYPWIHRAYRWFYNRLPDSQRQKAPQPITETAEGPASHLTPFPASLSESRSVADAGAIGFLSVDSLGSLSSGDASDPLNRHAYEAARFVFDLFRPLDAEIGYPRVTLDSEEGDGSSLSLAAIIASLRWILKVQFPDDLIATGSYDSKTQKLTAVSEPSLEEKIIAAARFGYKTFVVVSGQKSAAEQTPQESFDLLKEQGLIAPDTEMEFFEVHSDPLTAFFDLFRFATKKEGAAWESGLAKLLAIYDKKRIESLPTDGDADFLAIVKPFCANSSPLIRHVACDLMSRRALHLGKTAESDEYRQRAPRLEPTEFPSGWLGSYLKYEERASRSVLEIDRGYWDDDREAHSLSDRLLERIAENIDDAAADIEDLRSALALANTKALRLLFRARLTESPELARKAWREVTRFSSHWPAIFRYTRQKGLVDETLRRQENQAVQCAAAYRTLCGSLPSKIEIIRSQAPWEDEAEEQVGMPYNLASWLTLRLTLDSPPAPSEISRFFEEARRGFKPDSFGYPCYLPFEKMLIYKLGTEQEHAEAASNLRLVLQDLEHKKDTGILSIAALRAAAVLNDSQYTINSIVCRFPEESRFGKLAQNLASSPETIVFRAPY